MKSLIYAFFCLAVCGVIFLGLIKDDQANFSGHDGNKKFRPTKLKSKGQVLAALRQEKMAGDALRADRQLSDERSP